MNSLSSWLKRLSRTRDWHSFCQLFRFYQAAIVNTAFGISLYFLLVWLGSNIFAAQAISHVLGTAFNYFTYSRHVFHEAEPAKFRFALSYIGAYLLNAAVLLMVSQLIASPYLAGFMTALIVSALNFVVLKRLVFRSR